MVRAGGSPPLRIAVCVCVWALGAHRAPCSEGRQNVMNG